MPLEQAMRTQRAVRRLKADPVDDDVLLRVLELALKAPTSSDGQRWSFVVVRDPKQKARLGRLYRSTWRLYFPLARWAARSDERALRNMEPGRLQAENFEDIPVLVFPCYRRTLKEHPVGGPAISVSSFYGSVYPAVQNLLLACRSLGLGASIQTLPLWFVPGVRMILRLPRSVHPVCVVPIGWAEGRYGPTRRVPVEEVVHVDAYGNRPFRGR